MLTGRVILENVVPESVLTSRHEELNTGMAITDPSPLIDIPVLSGPAVVFKKLI
jgi:hypothetical protein